MSLKRVSLWAAISMGYFFLLRATGTFFPDIFLERSVVLTVSVLTLLFGLGLLFFYLSFRKTALSASLRSLAGWAVGGHIALSIVYAIELLRAWQIDFFPGILGSRVLAALMPVVPWLCAFFVMIFFISFHQEKRKTELGRLGFYALSGAALSFLLRSVILGNFVIARGGPWATDLTGTLLFVGIVVSFLSFLGFEYFFLSFFKGKDILKSQT